MARPTPAEAIRLLPRDAYLFDPASHALLDEVLAEGRLPRANISRWRLVLFMMVSVGLGLIVLAMEPAHWNFMGQVTEGVILDRLVEETAEGTTYTLVYAYTYNNQTTETRETVSEGDYHRYPPGQLVDVIIPLSNPATTQIYEPTPRINPVIARIALGWWGVTILLTVVARRRTTSARETLLEGEITRARLRRDEHDPAAHVVVINFDFLTPNGERAISGEDAFPLAPGSEMPAVGMPVIVRYRSPRRYHLL